MGRLLRLLFWLVLMLAAVAAAGLVLAARELPRRYDVLTAAAVKALDKGDARDASRFALAAMQGQRIPFLHFDTSKAQGLLLEALIKGQSTLSPAGQVQLPKFTATGDVIPLNAQLSDDGTQVMVMHNENRATWIYDIYELPSGKLLKRFPFDLSHNTGRRMVAGFSPDLKTTIISGTDGVFFRDTLSDKPVLPDFKPPVEYFEYAISNDRMRITAQSTDRFRVWDMRAARPVVYDYLPPKDAYMDGFLLSPDGSALVTEDRLMTKQVRDVKTHAIKWSLQGDGPIDIAFSPDNQFMASSQIVGSTPDNIGWKYSVLMWNASSYRAEGQPLKIGPVNNVSLIGGQVLALSGFTGVSFWDSRTQRIIAIEPGVQSVFSQGPSWRGRNAYTISGNHILTTYTLNSLFGLSDEELTAKACALWGRNAQLSLTEAEANQMKVHFSFDPCTVKL